MKRLDRAARGERALPALFVGSVIESSILPWPIEFPLLAVMLRGRRHVAPAMLAVTAGSAVGCLISYLAGLAALEALAPLIEGAASVEAARARMEEAGAWAVFLAMMAPVPVQLASFAAGLSGVAFGWFVLAVVTGRFLRYAAMGVLVFIFGEQVMAWWAGRSWRTRAAGLAVFLAAFVALFAWTLSGLAGARG